MMMMMMQAQIHEGHGREPTGLPLTCVNIVVLVVMLCVVLVVLVLMCCIAGWHGRALPEDDPGQGFNWNVLILLC